MKRTWLCVGLATGLLAGSGMPPGIVSHSDASEAKNHSAEKTSWEAKNAYRNCERAEAGSAPWPSEPASACAAMTLCINEAVLSAKQRNSLVSAMRRVPGCAQP